MNGYIFAVCIVSLLSGISGNLVENTKLCRQFRFILSMILLAVVFSPLANGEVLPDFSDVTDIYMSEEYSAELYNNQIKSQVSENVSAVLGSELEKNGIDYKFIETEVNISETNCIFISKVTVSTDNFERAEKIIKENLGEEMLVLNESG